MVGAGVGGSSWVGSGVGSGVGPADGIGVGGTSTAGKQALSPSAITTISRNSLVFIAILPVLLLFYPNYQS